MNSNTKRGDFSEKEIDGILSHLNKTYRDKINPEWAEKELDELETYLKKNYGKILTSEQKEYFRKVIKEKE